MKYIKQILLGASIAITCTATPLVANAGKPPLSKVPEIDNNMLYVAIAIEISEKCDRISARTLKGLNYLWSLKRQASDLGYSDDEIRAYVESDEQEARIRALGEAYVTSAGFDPVVAEDLCELGEAEIARNSLIGSLLREKN